VITTLSICVFSALILWVGHNFKSNLAVEDDFNIGRRNIPLISVVCGIFSVVGGAELVAMGALSAQFGYSSIWLFASFSIGCVLFLFFVESVRLYATVNDDERFQLLSIPDLVFLHFGKPTSVLATLLLLGALGSLLMLQLVLAGQLLSVLQPDVPKWIFEAVLVGVVGVYAVFSGYRGVLATDVIQISAMCLVFGYLAASGAAIPDETTASLWEPTQMGWSSLLPILIGGIFWVLGGGDIWQRVLSAKSSSDAKRAIIINSVMLLAFGFLLAKIGTDLAPYYGSDPDLSFANMISGLAGFVRILVALGIFAALISTTDTEILIISQIINREFIWGRLESTEKMSTRATQWLVLAVSLFALVSALMLERYAFSAYYVLLYFFIIVGMLALAALLGRGNKVTAFVGGLASLLYVVIYVVGVKNGATSVNDLWFVLVPPLINMIPTGMTFEDVKQKYAASTESSS